MDNRRELLKLAALTLAASLPSEASEKLPNAVHTAEGVSMTKRPFGEERIFFNGPTAQLKSLTAGSLLLYAGQEPHPPHQHPEEEIMLVTKGSAEILVDGKKHAVHQGGMMFCAGNQLHGIRNISSSAPMEFYFYKWQA